MVNTTSNWLCFGAFLSPPVPSLRIHWPLTTGRCSRATGHYSRATRHYLPRPSPAGYCLPPTAELRKIEWARSGRADPLSYYAPKQAIPAENPIRSPPLAAARPLIILSWPEALNASGSKRACRMAISRNACSLVALPDFPELAQAVRYGVPGTHQRPFSWVQGAAQRHDRLTPISFPGVPRTQRKQLSPRPPVCYPLMEICVTHEGRPPDRWL